MLTEISGVFRVKRNDGGGEPVDVGEQRGERVCLGVQQKGQQLSRRPENRGTCSKVSRTEAAADWEVQEYSTIQYSGIQYLS